MVEKIAADSSLKVMLTAVAVAVICALLVSYSAVTLRPYYLANLKAERQARLESILNALPRTMDEIGVDVVESHTVDLDTGEYSERVDPATYNVRQAVTDPNQSIAIPPERDAAGIKRRAHYAVVYILRDADKAVRAFILPVYGSGYQSTLYGFLALSADTKTVLGLKFYEQKDTPGIGARIQDPEWEALWPGKSVYDASGMLRLGVARGKVASGSEEADFLVDGVSGATRTSLGVHDLLRFWLGDLGFGPYLKRMRGGKANVQ